MSAEYEVSNVQQLVKDLHDTVEDMRAQTPESLAFQLTKLRRRVWWNFTVDTWQHTSALADQLEQRLRVLLTREISIDAAYGGWEIGLWEDVLEVRMAQPRQRATQKWWRATIRTLEEYLVSPSLSARQSCLTFEPRLRRTSTMSLTTLRVLPGNSRHC